MSKVIKFTNGSRFVVLLSLTLDEEQYLYLSNLDNASNNIFVKRLGPTTIEPVKNKGTITKLMELVAEQIEKINKDTANA